VIKLIGYITPDKRHDDDIHQGENDVEAEQSDVDVMSCRQFPQQAVHQNAEVQEKANQINPSKGKADLGSPGKKPGSNNKTKSTHVGAVKSFFITVKGFMIKYNKKQSGQINDILSVPDV